jgi:hypothetical protein
MGASMRAGTCGSFGWLWLTDLHWGQTGHRWLWPERREDFFEDLNRLHTQCGPWDFVLFTGDLVFSGTDREFSELTLLLNRLMGAIQASQEKPALFLSIPGNHDLVRPDPKASVAAAFRSWWADELVRDIFWDEASSDYRKAVSQAFEAYAAWTENNGLPRPADYSTGLLPGDFSATIAKGNASLGIVGLNSTFLQLSGGDFKEKLDIDGRQLNAVCGGDSARWLRERHVNFLLTHQPPDWLHATARERFRGAIYRPQNFAAHFCGHMHENSTILISEGVDQPRRHFQGISLFGLERFGEAFDKQRFRFGYSAGRLEVDHRSGRLYLWPRIAVKQQSGDWRLAPDQEHSLSEGTEYIGPINILLRTACGMPAPKTASDSEETLPRRLDAQCPRTNYLQRLKRESMARCMMRWRAAGVTYDVANTFVNDRDMGSPNSEMVPGTERRIVLLAGPIGSGKSLIGERIHQAAIERALSDPDAPLPVYLEIPTAFGRLAKAVDEEVTNAGGLHSQGVAVFLHEGIGGETADMRTLMNETRVLVDSRPGTTALLLSRDEMDPGFIEERVLVPPLSDQVALQLVNQVSGPMRGLPSWPSSVREAIRRPLFALLLGQYFRTTHAGGPRSIADLIANLVGEALGQFRSKRMVIEGLLRSIGAKVTDRGGGYVPVSEVIPLDQTVNFQPLLESGLVTRRDQTIAFPLSILTEWFAAEALAKGDLSADDIINDVQRLNRWYYPLLIVIGTQSHAIVTRILSPICRRYPGLSSLLIERGLSQWGISEEVMPPPALECGERLLEVANVWMQALGPLSNMVFPLKPDKRLQPLGVRTFGSWLIAGWYFGTVPLDPIVPMPDSVGLPVGGNLISSSWTGNAWSRRGARPGRDSSWAWRWVRDEIRDWITRVVRHKMFLPPTPTMKSEAAWQAALALVGAPSWPNRHIELQDIEQLLPNVGSRLWLQGRADETLYLQPLREEIELLWNSKADTLLPPWSPRSSTAASVRPGPLWWFCSDEEIADRVKFVYEAAIEGYQLLVQSWFGAFSGWMMHSIMMPNYISIYISVDREQEGYFRPPVVSYREGPLPRGSKSVVEVSVYENTNNANTSTLFSYDQIVSSLRSLRPETPPWFPLYLEGTFLAGDLFEQDAVTKVVYSWLERDLRNIQMCSNS